MASLLRFLAPCLLLAVQLSTTADEPTSASPDVLKDWQGHWEVLDSQASSGITFILGVQLGIAHKGTKVTVKGNQLFSADKLIATLTTDFSDTELEVEKKVWISRKPVLITLPDGKGILCAYESGVGDMEVVHPHNMGRIGAGSRLTLQRQRK